MLGLSGSVVRAMEGPGGGESNPFETTAPEVAPDFFTGAASLSIPILVPPGRSGMTPSLSLRYSSQAGLSEFGFGWTLAVGEITGSTKYGVPRCDGGATEEFVLSVAGTSNELVRQVDDSFLLRIDEGHAVAIPDRAANSWTVRTREGLTYHFGDATSARVFRAGDVFLAGSGDACALTTTWKLTRVEDPNGNQIDYGYRRFGNQVLLETVRWGGNRNTTIEHPFEIELKSEAISVASGKPIARSWATGVDRRIARRMRSIDVRVWDPDDRRLERLRRYTLVYDDDLPTAEFLLAAVETSDLPRRTFTYATSETRIVDDLSRKMVKSEDIGLSFPSSTYMRLQDMNGDGLIDRFCSRDHHWNVDYGIVDEELQFSDGGLCESSSDTWSPPPALVYSKRIDFHPHRRTADITGDGIPDYLYQPRTSSKPDLYVEQGQCAEEDRFDCGFGPGPVFDLSSFGSATDDYLYKTSKSGWAVYTSHELIDMNGDGLPDNVRTRRYDGSGGPTDWSVHLNTGSGFESEPIVYRDAHAHLGVQHGGNDDQWTDPSVALFDVNGDGLPDLVEAAHIDRVDSHPTSRPIPRFYFLVYPDGESVGPFALDEGYICRATDPPIGGTREFPVLCPGRSIPPGAAFVPAMSVRLNTGHGFSERVFSPAPTFETGERKEQSNHLRAFWVSNSPARIFRYRDFVDVNGDGRVDWVMTGRQFDGSDNWYVLFNLGDGRFGGGLEILEGARLDTEHLVLGEVRPASALANGGVYLAKNTIHASPPSLNQVTMTIVDIDGDGIAERIEPEGGVGPDDRWRLKRLVFDDAENPHTKPMLLVRADDGVGGKTYFRYRPATDFNAASETSPRLPFPLWVVTAIRRTDGLCDDVPSNWFSISGSSPGNPCLARGHETVQEIAYADGHYDGESREFRGFRMVKVWNGPETVGSETRFVHFQDEFRKGKVASERVFLGGLEPYLLSETTYDWRAVTDAETDRTQLFLQEQRLREFPLFSDGLAAYAEQCTVHRNSLYTRDSIDPNDRPHPYGLVLRTCSMGCVGAGESDDLCSVDPVGKKQVETFYAEPTSGSSSSILDRPVLVSSYYVDASGSEQLSGRSLFAYDDLPFGEISRGNLSTEQQLVSEAPERWITKEIEYDLDHGGAIGNVVSIRTMRPDIDRTPTRIEYDPEFQLHPVREIAPHSPDSPYGTPALVVEREYDLRHAKVVETIGVHGRAAGDVSGTHYDSLGRPVCEFQPGTSCDTTSGFSGSVEYVYRDGDPSAASSLDRLSSLEIRRREPNAPLGYISTTSYWDALGRECLVTDDRNVVTRADSSAVPSLETVVVRHQVHGPNGKVVASYAPYVAGPAPSLDEPVGRPMRRFSYEFNGNAEGLLDPEGFVHATTRYNGTVARRFRFGDSDREVDGAPVDLAGPNGNHVLRRFDAHGRVIRRESYAGSDRLLSTSDRRYDGRDEVVAEWFAGSLGTRIEKAYDLVGRLVSKDDPDSGRWTNRYDAAGNLVHVDDPETGQSIQYCYDELDRVVLQCARAADSFDANLCAAVDPACAARFDFDYDATDPVGGLANFGRGALSSVVGADSRHVYGYDVRGRLTREVDTIRGITATTGFEYFDDLDRLHRVSYPDGERFEYGYDASGQPNRLYRVNANGLPSSKVIVRDIAYEPNGRPTRIERGNLTVDEYTYEASSRGLDLTRITTRDVATRATSTLVDLRYARYDALSRPAWVSDELDATGPLSMTARYGYDGIGRLMTVEGPAGEAIHSGGESFAYDSIGNIRTINGSVFVNDPDGLSANGPHQFNLAFPTTSGGPPWQFAFDRNGRKTLKRRSDGSVVQTYGYDVFGRLRTLGVGSRTKTFGYDHAGRRVYETVSGSTRRFFGAVAEAERGLLYKRYFIGDRLLATSAEPAALLSEGPAGGFVPSYLPAGAYLSILGSAILLLVVPVGARRVTLGVRVARSGALGSAILVAAIWVPIVVAPVGCSANLSVRHYHTNHLGSVIAVTGYAAQLERQYRYSAYGEVRRYDGEGDPIAGDPQSRSEFTGYQTDFESGLQYAGARYYDPSQAHFLTPDPEEQFANPYAYVGWNPVTTVDPDGEEAFTLTFGALQLIISVALVVVQSVAVGIQTGSVGKAFETLAIGLGSLVGGLVGGGVVGQGIQTLPPAIQPHVRGAVAAAGVGQSIYSVASAEGSVAGVFAGIGLARSVIGSAFSANAAARRVPDDPEQARARLFERVRDVLGDDVLLAQHDAFGSRGPGPLFEIDTGVEGAGRAIVKGAFGSAVGHALERLAASQPPGTTRGVLEVTAGGIRVVGGFSIARGGFVVAAVGNSTVLHGNPFGLVGSVFGTAVFFGGLRETAEGFRMIQSGSAMFRD